MVADPVVEVRAERASRPGWVPKLVALDIDGTLLRWVDGAGQTHAEVSEAVADAVRRARAAGAHVVLASGRGVPAEPPRMEEVAEAAPAAPTQRVGVRRRGSLA